MVNLIVNEIVTRLTADVSFVDKITGIVKPAKVSISDQVKTLPVAVNTDVTTCNDSELLDFVPDNSKKSIIYFEDRGTSLVKMENQSLYYTASFTLICWFNFNQIDHTLTNTSKIAGVILKRLPIVLGNITPLIGVVLSVNGQQPNDGGVFSKYSYLEEQTQYILYPFGYVAFDLTASFSVRKDCIPEIVEDVDECDTRPLPVPTPLTADMTEITADMTQL